MAAQQKPRPPRQSLPDRVERRVEGLAREMVTQFSSAIPVYRTLPKDQLLGEIHSICVANLRLMFSCLRADRGPTPDELNEPRASAARRAEERVPLDAVLSAYMTGARLGWQALVREAEADEQDELIGYVEIILSYLRTVAGVVSEAYVEEQQAIVGEERDARRNLTEALLTGATVQPGLVERAGVRPAERYRAVAVKLGQSPEESEPGISAAIAGRRKTRRIQQALEELIDGPLLSLLDAGGGAIALPLVDTTGLLPALGESGRCEVWVAMSDPVRLPALPHAWIEAREVRRLIGALRKPPGLYTMSDVLLERTLTADDAAAARLAAVLDPLEEKENLLETLEAWFGADFDRRAAAQRLVIHPNTLDYRLRRVSEILDTDVASAAGSQLLGAALMARRLRQ